MEELRKCSRCKSVIELKYFANLLMDLGIEDGFTLLN